MDSSSKTTSPADFVGHEYVMAVPMPRYRFGYRSYMGDIVELQDGRLLMAYKATTHTG